MIAPPKDQATCLVCRLAETPGLKNSEQSLITRTPLSCFNEATKKNFDLLTINFSTRALSSRDAVFELCKCLKNNPLTKNIPIVLSIEAMHRGIVLMALQIGVDFIAPCPCTEPIDCRRLATAVRTGGEMATPERLLGTLCPFLHYAPIEDRCELITAHSGDSGHGFRPKAGGSSDGSRPAIPGQGGHTVGAQRRWW